MQTSSQQAPLPFLNLKTVHEQYQDELLEAMKRVLHSGWYIRGKEVQQFEYKMAQYVGVNHCIAVGNGLDALRLILRAYIQLGKLAKGDHIIVPYNTFIATVLAITEEGLKPIFISPDPNTFNLDSTKLRSCLTAKTKAIMPVHLYGRVCFDRELQQFAQRYKLLIIGDAAQSMGAECNGKKSASLGNAAATSFYPGKNLGALGDGGAVFTNNENLANIIRALANYGSEQKYVHRYKGMNSRLDELQAAVLSVRLKYLDNENKRRRVIASYYNRNIDNQHIQLPNHPQNASHVWHLYVIRTAHRTALQKHLDRKGIQTQIHYPIPIYQQEAYSNLVVRRCKITEQLHNEILSLPMSPVLKPHEVNRVIDAVNSFRP